MQLNEVIGQDSVKDMLRQMADQDRVPHAMLFLGSPGCGKLTLAWAFAKYILCENPEGGDACGQCSQCRKSAGLIHPDLHFSFPTVGSKVTSDSFLNEWRLALSKNPYLGLNEWLQQIGAENKQGNINKDECNNIVRKLSLKTFEGKKKILIMWLPELLGKEGNRLLKIIEEPPENTVFILVAEDQDKILNTILSRCQLIKIAPLQDEEVVNGLVQKTKLAAEKAHTIAHLANGNFDEAIHLAVEEESEESSREKLFLDWFRKCYVGNSVTLVQWVETFAKAGRENQKHFLQYALHFMREYMLLRLTGREDIRLQPSEQTTAKRMLKVISFEQVEEIAQILSDCSFYIERNANPKVLFLDTSIRLHAILSGKESQRQKALHHK